MLFCGGIHMTEGEYQASLKKRIEERIPGALVIKNDPTYVQGIPDLLILKGKRWAALEVKISGKASHRPNQRYYVDKMNDWSFAAFIFPENEEEVISELERAFSN